MALYLARCSKCGKADKRASVKKPGVCLVPISNTSHGVTRWTSALTVSGLPLVVLCRSCAGLRGKVCATT